MVMVKCPITLLKVETGIITNEAALQLIKAEVAEFNCPACGQTHQWSLIEHWLAESRASEALAVVTAPSAL
jgi:hypothetical protein